MVEYEVFDPESQLEEYPKGEGMVIYSEDFNEIAEELQSIGNALHGIYESMSGIEIKMASFEGALDALEDQIDGLNTASSDYNIALSANPLVVLGDGKSKSTIRAIVKDDDGNAVPGAEVNFVTNAGTLGKTKVTTDSRGMATTSLTSAIARPPIHAISKPELLERSASNLLRVEGARIAHLAEKIKIGPRTHKKKPPVIGRTSTRASVRASCDSATSSITVTFEVKEKPKKPMEPVTRPKKKERVKTIPKPKRRTPTTKEKRRPTTTRKRVAKRRIIR
jgi:hypothetical protein